MTLHVRQRVVCIGTEGTPNIDWDTWCTHWKIARPTRGGIYTVRDARIGRAGRQHIRLVEIVNPSAEFSDAPSQEPWWWASAFRPITDISIFTKMLKPKKVEA